MCERQRQGTGARADPDAQRQRTHAVGAGLYFAEGREWRPLPEWARFFVEVGAAVGGSRDQDARLVVAMVAPIRAYAAAFTALGVIASQAAETRKLNLGEHLQRLRSLQPGTPVLYVESGRKRKAVLLGCASLPSGEIRFRLRFERTPGARESGGLVEWLPLSCAPGIRIVDEASAELPKKQKAAPIIDNAAFVGHALGIPDVSEFALNASNDCLIVGTIRALRAELTSAQFSLAPPAATGTQGTLKNDILRVRQFLAQDEPHHSEVLKCSGEVSPADAGRPHVVVFDGPQGSGRPHSAGTAEPR